MNYWWDLAIMHWIQGSLWTPWGFIKLPSLLDGVMLAITELGAETFWILVVSLLFWLGYKRESLLLGALIIVEAMINLWLKYAILRPRPTKYEVFVFYDASGPSMPSGHAQLVATASFYTAKITCPHLQANQEASDTTLYLKKKCITVYSLAFALTVLVSISRVYLGAHWPTDVISGSLVGFILFAVYSVTAERLWKVVQPHLPQNLLYRCVLVVVIGITIGFFAPYYWRIGWYVAGFFTGFFVGALLEVDAVKLKKPTSIKKAIERMVVGNIVLIALAAITDKIISLIYVGSDLLELLLFPLLPSQLSPWIGTIADLILEPYISPFFGVAQFPIYALIGLWISFIAPYLFKALKI